MVLICSQFYNSSRTQWGEIIFPPLGIFWADMSEWLLHSCVFGLSEDGWKSRRLPRCVYFPSPFLPSSPIHCLSRRLAGAFFTSNMTISSYLSFLYGGWLSPKHKSRSFQAFFISGLLKCHFCCFYSAMTRSSHMKGKEKYTLLLCGEMAKLYWKREHNIEIRL